MGVIEREAGTPPIGENDHFIVKRQKAWARILRAHSLVGCELTRLPFGDRLAIDGVALRESGIRFITRLNRAPDFWGRRSARMRSCSRRFSRFSRRSSLSGSTRNRRHALKPPSCERSAQARRPVPRSCLMQDNNLLARREPGG